MADKVNTQLNRVRQTYSDRIYVPGLTRYFNPPVLYKIDSIRVMKKTGELLIKIKVLNVNEEKVSENEQ